MLDGRTGWQPDTTPISDRATRDANIKLGSEKRKLVVSKDEKPTACPRPTPKRNTRRR